MKIIIKVNEDNELVSIHCSEKDVEVELYDYHACVICGDATEKEMDVAFEDAAEDMHLIYDTDTYWKKDFED